MSVWNNKGVEISKDVAAALSLFVNFTNLLLFWLTPSQPRWYDLYQGRDVWFTARGMHHFMLKMDWHQNKTKGNAIEWAHVGEIRNIKFLTVHG